MVKSETFAGAFPRGVVPSDIDQVVELNGHFLFAEWKRNRSINWAQETLLKRLSEIPCMTVFQVVGNCLDMTVAEYRLYWKGKPMEWVKADIDELFLRYKSWAEWADNV